MFKLLKPFFWEAVRMHRLVLCASLVLLVLTKIFKLEELGAVVLLIPFGALFGMIPIVNGNLNWVLSLPISKNSIMWRVFCLNLLHVLCAGVELLVLGIVYVSLFLMRKENFPEHAKEKIADAFLLTPGELGFCMFFLCFGAAVLFPSKPLAAIHAAPVSKQQQRSNLLWWAGFWAIGSVIASLLFRFGFVTPFLACLAAIVALPLGIVSHSLNAMGFSRTYRRRWLAGTLSICTVCLAMVYSNAWGHLRGGRNAEDRYNASSFLGAFSGNFNQHELLVSFLKEDIPANVVSELTSSLGKIENKSFFFESNYWLDQRKSELKFRDLIATKKSRAAVTSVAELFDPYSMSRADLDAYLQLVSTLPDDGGDLKSAYWVYLPLDENEVVELIESPNKEALRVGLAYARFHPKEEYYTAILRLVPTLESDTSIAWAMFTLGSLSAELRDTRRHYASIMNKGAPKKGGYLEPGCSGVKEELLSDARVLRYFQCQRKASLNKSFVDVIHSDKGAGTRSAEKVKLEMESWEKQNFTDG